MAAAFQQSADSVKQESPTELMGEPTEASCCHQQQQQQQQACQCCVKKPTQDNISGGDCNNSNNMVVAMDDGPTAVAEAPPAAAEPTEVTDTPADTSQAAGAQQQGSKRILMLRQLPKFGRRGRGESVERQAKAEELVAAAPSEHEHDDHEQQHDDLPPLQHKASATPASAKTSALSNDIPTKFALEDDVGLKDASARASPRQSKPDVAHEESKQNVGARQKKAPAKGPTDARRPSLLKRVRALWSTRGGRGADKDNGVPANALPAGLVTEDNATNSNTHISVEGGAVRVPETTAEWVEELAAEKHRTDEQQAAADATAAEEETGTAAHAAGSKTDKVEVISLEATEEKTVSHGEDVVPSVTTDEEVHGAAEDADGTHVEHHHEAARTESKKAASVAGSQPTLAVDETKVGHVVELEAETA